METNVSLPSCSARVALTGRSILVLAAATLLVLLGARSSPDDRATATSVRNVAERSESPQRSEETTRLAHADRASVSRFRLIM